MLYTFYITKYSLKINTTHTIAHTEMEQRNKTNNEPTTIPLHTLVWGCYNTCTIQ